jgi:hypothetical protein
VPPLAMFPPPQDADSRAVTAENRHQWHHAVLTWVGGRVDLASCILNLAGWLGAVHSAHKEAAMEEYSLTLGAHLLLWAFPLVLVVLVIVEDLHDRLKSGSER